MIKILFFIPNLSDGGAEKSLRNLVNNMDQSRFDITVQTIVQQRPEQYLAPGINYKAINRCKSNIGKKLMQYWFRFCTEFGFTYPIYIKGDYDIEVAYLECGATKVMAASTNRKSLKLAWVHCDLTKKGVTSGKSKHQYEAYDKVVCVSEDTKRAFDEIFDNCIQSVVLHNVIDEKEIINKSEEVSFIKQNGTVKNLLAVGRLSEQKAFDYLIKTCGRLHGDGYRFHLRILGEGPERAKLKALIRDLDLQGTVELCGFTENPYAYMKAADYIVCSSKYEGLSTVIIEALILSKPIVTTPCTGMRELLGDSEYGLIVEDGEAGLYNGLKQMMDSPELESRYIEMAKKRGTDFTKETLIKQTEIFFAEELEKKQCTHRGKS